MGSIQRSIHSDILNFRPAETDSDAASQHHLLSVLRDYNLINAFKMGKLFFAVDGGLYNAVHDLFIKEGLEPLVSICSPHNWGKATSRAIQDNLVSYWPEGANTVQVISIFY